MGGGGRRNKTLVRIYSPELSGILGPVSRSARLQTTVFLASVTGPNPALNIRCDKHTANILVVWKKYYSWTTNTEWIVFYNNVGYVGSFRSVIEIVYVHLFIIT